jgi:hypothetical protein
MSHGPSYWFGVANDLPLYGQNRSRGLLAVVVRGSRPVKIDFGALELNGCQCLENDLSIRLATDVSSRKRAAQGPGGCS